MAQAPGTGLFGAGHCVVAGLTFALQASLTEPNSESTCFPAPHRRIPQAFLHWGKGHRAGRIHTKLTPKIRHQKRAASL